MKKSKMVTVSVLVVICIIAAGFLMFGNKSKINNINCIIDYSALYDEKLIDEAFDVIEAKFSSDFEGCTLTELRYDDEVENKFADEMMRYGMENNQELIIVLSTFDTDEKGGDGSFRPNDTYTDWQWHLIRTADKKSWEIIGWGY